jgi:hypothetical protein
MICLLTEFAFGTGRADVVFGCDIADCNVASIRAFQKAGHTITSMIEQPFGRKARHRVALMIEGSHI